MADFMNKTFQEQIADFLQEHPNTWTELTHDDCMKIASDLLDKFFNLTRDKSPKYNIDMEQQNSLLRSAYVIAQREGKNTHWSAFAFNLLKELMRQAGVPADSENEQEVLRATCTPLTYRADSHRN